MRNRKMEKTNFKVKHPYGHIIKSMVVGFVLVFTAFAGIFTGGLLNAKGEVKAFSGGSGTYTDPYLISTSYDLYSLRASSSANKYYQLTKNIDFTHTSSPFTQFKGILNGCGYTITNNTSYPHLFGTLASTSVVHNLYLNNTNSSITLLSNYYSKGSFGMLSMANNGGTIENVKVISTANIIVSANYISYLEDTDGANGPNSVGSIVGSTTNGIIRDCGSTLKFTVTDVRSNRLALGGIVGSAITDITGSNYENNTIDGNFYTGTIKVNNMNGDEVHIGGIVGKVTAASSSTTSSYNWKVTNNYFGGTVEGTFATNGVTYDAYYEEGEETEYEYEETYYAHPCVDCGQPLETTLWGDVEGAGHSYCGNCGGHAYCEYCDVSWYDLNQIYINSGALDQYWLESPEDDAHAFTRTVTGTTTTEGSWYYPTTTATTHTYFGGIVGYWSNSTNNMSGLQFNVVNCNITATETNFKKMRQISAIANLPRSAGSTTDTSAIFFNRNFNNMLATITPYSYRTKAELNLTTGDYTHDDVIYYNDGDLGYAWEMEKWAWVENPNATPRAYTGALGDLPYNNMPTSADAAGMLYPKNMLFCDINNQFRSNDGKTMFNTWTSIIEDVGANQDITKSSDFSISESSYYAYTPLGFANGLYAGLNGDISFQGMQLSQDLDFYGFVYDFVNDDTGGYAWEIEGNDHILTNLYMRGDRRSDTSGTKYDPQPIGLFAYAKGLIVSGFTIRNAAISINDPHKATHVGIIAGELHDYVEIFNIQLQGIYINVYNMYLDTGITNLTNHPSVYDTSLTTNIGGIVGSMDNSCSGEVSDVYITGYPSYDGYLPYCENNNFESRIRLRGIKPYTGTTGWISVEVGGYVGHDYSNVHYYNNIIQKDTLWISAYEMIDESFVDNVACAYAIGGMFGLVGNGSTMYKEIDASYITASIVTNNLGYDNLRIYTGGVFGAIKGQRETSVALTDIMVSTYISLSGNGSSDISGGVIGYHGGELIINSTIVDTDINPLQTSTASVGSLIGLDSNSIDQKDAPITCDNVIIDTYMPGYTTYTTSTNKTTGLGNDLSLYTSSMTNVFINAYETHISTTSDYVDTSSCLYIFGTEYISQLDQSKFINNIASGVDWYSLYNAFKMTTSSCMNSTSFYIGKDVVGQEENGILPRRYYSYGQVYVAPYGLVDSHNYKIMTYVNNTPDIAVAFHGYTLENGKTYKFSEGDWLYMTNSDTSTYTAALKVAATSAGTPSKELIASTSAASGGYTCPNNFVTYVGTYSYLYVEATQNKMYFLVKVPYDYRVYNIEHVCSVTNAESVGYGNDDTENDPWFTWIFSAEPGAEVTITLSGNTQNYLAVGDEYDYPAIRILSDVYRGVSDYSSVENVTALDASQTATSTSITFTANSTTASTSSEEGSIIGYEFTYEKMVMVQALTDGLTFSAFDGTFSGEYTELWLTQFIVIDFHQSLPEGKVWSTLDINGDIRQVDLSDELSTRTEVLINYGNASDPYLMEASTTFTDATYIIEIYYQNEGYSQNYGWEFEGYHEAIVPLGAVYQVDSATSQSTTNQISSGNSIEITHGTTVYLYLAPGARYIIDTCHFECRDQSTGNLTANSSNVISKAITSDTTIWIDYAQDQWIDSGNAATAFAGGNGESSTPYLISTPAQWGYFLSYANTATGATKHYQLTADIDVSAKYSSGITTEFTGSFNGNGHVITGVRLCNYGGAYSSLFATNSGTIKNVIFDQVNTFFVRGSHYALVAGINKGIISQVGVKSARTSSGFDTTQGLIGMGDMFASLANINLNTIEKSFADVYSWTGDGSVGVSYVNMGRIDNVYVTSHVDDGAGATLGFYADDYSSSYTSLAAEPGLYNSYFAGILGSSIKGVIGLSNSNKVSGYKVENFYWLDTLGANAYFSGGFVSTHTNVMALTDTQLKAQTNLTGFNFANVWRYKDTSTSTWVYQRNLGYPLLGLWDTTDMLTINVRYYENGGQSTSSTVGWAFDQTSYLVFSGQSFTFDLLPEGNAQTYLQRIAIGSTVIKDAATIDSEGTSVTGYVGLSSGTVTSTVTLNAYFVTPIYYLNEEVDGVDISQYFDDTTPFGMYIGTGLTPIYVREFAIKSEYSPLYVQSITFISSNVLTGEYIDSTTVNFGEEEVSTSNGTYAFISNDSLGRTGSFGVCTSHNVAIKFNLVAKVKVSTSGNVPTGDFMSIDGNKMTTSNASPYTITKSITDFNATLAVDANIESSGVKYVINYVSVNGDTKYTNTNNASTSYTCNITSDDFATTNPEVLVDVNFKYGSYEYKYILSSINTITKPTKVNIGDSSFASVSVGQELKFQVNSQEQPEFAISATGGTYRIIISTSNDPKKTGLTTGVGEFDFTDVASTQNVTRYVHVIQAFALNGLVNTRNIIKNGFETHYKNLPVETATVTTRAGYWLGNMTSSEYNYVEYNDTLTYSTDYASRDAYGSSTNNANVINLDEVYEFNGWYSGSSNKSGVSPYNVTINSAAPSVLTPTYTLKTYEVEVDTVNNATTNNFKDEWVGIVYVYQFDASANDWLWNTESRSNEFDTLSSSGSYHSQYLGMESGVRKYVVTAGERIAVARYDGYHDKLASVTHKNLSGTDASYVMTEYADGNGVKTGTYGFLREDSLIEFTYFPMIKVNLVEELSATSLRAENLGASGLVAGTAEYGKGTAVNSTTWEAGSGSDGKVFMAGDYIRIAHTVPTANLTGLTWNGFKIGDNYYTSQPSGGVVGNVTIHALSSTTSGSNTIYYMVITVAVPTDGTQEINLEFTSKFTEKTSALSITGYSADKFSAMFLQECMSDTPGTWQQVGDEYVISHTIGYYGYYRIYTDLKIPYLHKSTPYTFTNLSSGTIDDNLGNGYSEAVRVRQRFTMYGTGTYSQTSSIALNTTQYYSVTLGDLTDLLVLETVTAGTTYTVTGAWSGTSYKLSMEVISGATGTKYTYTDLVTISGFVYQNYLYVLAGNTLTISTTTGTGITYKSSTINGASGKTVTASANITSIVVTYSENSYTMTLVNGLAGSASGSETATTQALGYFGKAFIKATVSADKRFSSWSGSNVTINNTASVSTYITQPTKATTITANLEQLYTLNKGDVYTHYYTDGITTSGGTISATVNGDEVGGGYYPVGTAVSLSYTVTDGFTFAYFQISTNDGATWTSISRVNATYVLTSANTIIRGTFEELNYFYYIFRPQDANGNFLTDISIESNCAGGYGKFIERTITNNNTVEMHTYEGVSVTYYVHNGKLYSDSAHTNEYTKFQYSISGNTLTIYRLHVGAFSRIKIEAINIADGYRFGYWDTSIGFGINESYSTIAKDGPVLTVEGLKSYSEAHVKLFAEKEIKLNYNQHRYHNSTQTTETPAHTNIVREAENKVKFVYNDVTITVYSPTLVATVTGSGASAKATMKILTGGQTLYVNNGKLYVDSAHTTEYGGKYTIVGTTVTINQQTYTVSSNKISVGGSLVTVTMTVNNANTQEFSMIKTPNGNEFTSIPFSDSSKYLSGSGSVSAGYTFTFVANDASMSSTSQNAITLFTIPLKNVATEQNPSFDDTLHYVNTSGVHSVYIKEGTNATIVANDEIATSTETKAYKFVEWDFSGTSWMTADQTVTKSLTFPVYSNRAGVYTANYQYAYKLKTSAVVLDGTNYTVNSGAGTITPEVISGTYYSNDFTYLAGTTVRLSATENSGYKFKGWYTYDGTTYTALSTNNPYSSITSGANFETTTYVAVYENIVSLNIAIDPSNSTDAYVTYSVTASSGKLISSTYDSSTASQHVEVTKGSVLTINVNVSENFGYERLFNGYNLDANKNKASAVTGFAVSTSNFGFGSTTSTTATAGTVTGHKVNENSSIVFSFIPTFTLATPTSSTTNVTNGRTASGVSTAPAITSETASSTSGAVKHTFGGVARYDQNAQVIFSATVATGYIGEFTSTSSGTKASSGNTYTFTYVTNDNLADLDFTATEISYAISTGVQAVVAGGTAVANSGGTISVVTNSTRGNGTVGYFGSATVTATASTGYRFKEFVTSGTASFSSKTTNPITINSPRSAITLTASFLGISSIKFNTANLATGASATPSTTASYSWTYASTGLSGDGTLNVGGIVEGIDAGASVTLTTTQLSGYVFKYWVKSTDLASVLADPILNSEKILSTELSFTIDITTTGLHEFVAVYNPTYQVVVNAPNSTQGSVTVDGNAISTNQTYTIEHGKELILVATANPDAQTTADGKTFYYKFSKWTNASETTLSTSTTYVPKITSNVTLTANFTEDDDRTAFDFTLTLNNNDLVDVAVVDANNTSTNYLTADSTTTSINGKVTTYTILVNRGTTLKITANVKNSNKTTLSSVLYDGNEILASTYHTSFVASSFDSTSLPSDVKSLYGSVASDIDGAHSMTISAQDILYGVVVSRNTTEGTVAGSKNFLYNDTVTLTATPGASVDYSGFKLRGYWHAQNIDILANKVSMSSSLKIQGQNLLYSGTTSGDIVIDVSNYTGYGDFSLYVDILNTSMSGMTTVMIVNYSDGTSQQSTSVAYANGYVQNGVGIQNGEGKTPTTIVIKFANSTSTAEKTAVLRNIRLSHISWSQSYLTYADSIANGYVLNGNNLQFLANSDTVGRYVAVFEPTYMAEVSDNCESGDCTLALTDINGNDANGVYLTGGSLSLAVTPASGKQIETIKRGDTVVYSRTGGAVSGYEFADNTLTFTIGAATKGSYTVTCSTLSYNVTVTVADMNMGSVYAPHETVEVYVNNTLTATMTAPTDYSVTINALFGSNIKIVAKSARAFKLNDVDSITTFTTTTYTDADGYSRYTQTYTHATAVNGDTTLTLNFAGDYWIGYNVSGAITYGTTSFGHSEEFITANGGNASYENSSSSSNITFPYATAGINKGKDPSNPIKITSAAQLARVAYLVNSNAKYYYAVNSVGTSSQYYYSAYYEIQNDIDLGQYLWVPIAQRMSSGFGGALYGKVNVNINDMKIYFTSAECTTLGSSYGLGFFDTTTGSSTIKDLTFKNVILSAKHHSGILASRVSGSWISNINIIDSYIYGTLVSGLLYKSNANSFLTNISILNTYIDSITASTGFVYELSGTVSNIYIQTTLKSERFVYGFSQSLDDYYQFYKTAVKNIVLNNEYIVANNSRIREIFNTTYSSAIINDVYLNNNSEYMDYSGSLALYEYTGVNNEIPEFHLPASYNKDTFDSLDFENIWYWDSELNMPQLKTLSNDVTNKTYIKGVCTVGEFTGTGSESDPYLINTVNDLFLLAHKVNSGDTTYNYAGANFLLTADLNLAGYLFTPIGTNTYPFKGNFDGGYHTISNIYINTLGVSYDGLFGYVYAGISQTSTTAIQSTIKNLNIDNIDIFGRGTSKGGLAGYLTGRIENISVNAEIYSINTSAGGIIGYMSYTANNEYNIIKNVSFSGYISADNSAGIVYAIQSGNSGSKFQIINAINNGTMIAVASASGICGYNGTTGANYSLLISDCVNNGKLYSRKASVGGILGQGVNITLQRSYNNGEIHYFGEFTNSSTYSAGENWTDGTYYWKNTASNFIGELVGRLYEPYTGYTNSVLGCYYNSNKKIYISNYGITLPMGDKNLYGNTPNGVSAWSYNSGGTQYNQGTYTGGGVRVSEGELKMQSTFTGYDFSKTWGMYSGVNNDMPTLKFTQENKVYINVNLGNGSEEELTVVDNVITTADGTITANVGLNVDFDGNVFAYVLPGENLVLDIVSGANSVIERIGTSNYYNPSYVYDTSMEGEGSYTYTYTVPSTFNDGETYRKVDVCYMLNNFSLTVINTITHASGITVGENDCLHLVVLNTTTNRAYYAKATGTNIVFTGLQAGDYYIAIYKNAFYEVGDVTTSDSIDLTKADYYYTFTLGRDTAIDATISLTATKTNDYWIYSITNL